LGLIAPHGGGIEPGTEEIARYVAHHSGASLYVYSGRRPVGNLALHRASHGSELQTRPLVYRFLNYVHRAISIHGHGRDQRYAYVGGLNQAMVERFVSLAQKGLPQYKWVYSPESIPEGIRGRDPNNIVNLPPGKGMQLELSKALRQIKPAHGGEHFEPAGDALELSQLLVTFVGMAMDSNR
jgi:phage replication-related protein YjqB (UPF0714/DUF867 family)